MKIWPNLTEQEPCPVPEQSEPVIREETMYDRVYQWVEPFGNGNEPLYCSMSGRDIISSQRRRPEYDKFSDQVCLDDFCVVNWAVPKNPDQYREKVAEALQKFWQGPSGRTWEECKAKLPPQAEWFRKLADTAMGVKW